MVRLIRNLLASVGFCAVAIAALVVALTAKDDPTVDNKLLGLQPGEPDPYGFMEA